MSVRYKQGSEVNKNDDGTRCWRVQGAQGEIVDVKWLAVADRRSLLLRSWEEDPMATAGGVCAEIAR